MWTLWKIPAGSDAEEYLIFNQWVLVLNTIDALAMAIVLVRTYKNSRFPYLFTCAALMFFAVFFGLLANILYDWEIGC
jgi:hypothetical protein